MKDRNSSGNSKILKVITVILLCISILFLYACSDNANIETEPTATPILDLGFSDFDSGITLFINREDDKSMNQAGLNIWEKYIQDKYGMDFSARNILSIASELNAKSLLDESNLHGFIYLYKREELNKLIDLGFVVPINEYVNDIEIYAVADDMAFKEFTDSKGDIWGFPVELSPKSNMRYYNKEWLMKAGVEVPRTVDELYEYAKFVAYEDPDGNGIDDTYFAEFSVPGLMNYFTDIYKAFGCYIYNSSPIAYNPLTSKIEHSVYNENFKEATEFIFQMYKEGLTVKNDALSVPKKDNNRNYKVASTVRTDFTEITDSFSGWDFGHYLEGVNDNALIEVTGSEECIAVLCRTENVVPKLNYFINAVADSKYGWYDFFIGMEGAQYDVIDGKVEVKAEFDQMVKMSLMLNYLTFNSYGDFYNMDTVTDDEKVTMGFIDALRLGIADGFRYYSTDLAYTLPIDYVSTEVTELSRSISGDTQRLFWNILNEELTFEQALQIYGTQMDLRGIEGKIDEINTRFE